MTIATREGVRELKASDYASRFAWGDDLKGLFEFSLHEGWLSGLADAIELAQEQGAVGIVSRLRALAREQRAPDPICSREISPSSPPKATP